MSDSSEDRPVPLRWQNIPDGRSRGTFSQFVRDFLANKPEGVAREAVIAAAERAGLLHLPGSRSETLRALRRLIDRGELAETAGGLAPTQKRKPARRSARKAELFRSKTESH
jgi:hypothetical protein